AEAQRAGAPERHYALDSFRRFRRGCEGFRTGEEARCDGGRSRGRKATRHAIAIYSPAEDPVGGGRATQKTITKKTYVQSYQTFVHLDGANGREGYGN